MMLRYKGCCSESGHDKTHVHRNQRVSNMWERQKVGLDSETLKYVKEGRSNHLEKYGHAFFALKL